MYKKTQILIKTCKENFHLDSQLYANCFGHVTADLICMLDERLLRRFNETVQPNKKTKQKQISSMSV